MHQDEGGHISLGNEPSGKGRLSECCRSTDHAIIMDDHGFSCFCLMLPKDSTKLDTDGRSGVAFISNLRFHRVMLQQFEEGVPNLVAGWGG